MEQQMQEAGKLAMREAMKQAIRQWEQQQQTCPQCGQQQRRLEGPVRRTMATVFGRVHTQRRRFRGQGCGRRWCPANDLFAELQGGTISAALQEAALQAGCSWPYRVASSLLKRLSGAQISPEEMRLLTDAHGKERANLQQEEAECSCASAAKKVPKTENTEQPLLVGLDGGWVGSREQRGGMEGKVAVVCSQMENLPMPVYDTTFSWSERGVPRRPPRQRHRLSTRRYVATFGSSRHLGSQAKAAALNLDADPARPGVVIADGAEWIKQEQSKHFPQATCILVWAHIWREVSHAIRIAARAKALPEHERDFHLYFHRTCLWVGNVEQALDDLHRLST